MPPKKGKLQKKPIQRFSDADEDNSQYLDAQYNPQAVYSMLEDLGKQLENKCNHMQKETDFLVTSMQEAFHIELIKLPTEVKTMSLARFKAEFGESLEAVTLNAIGGSHPTKSNNSIYQSAVKPHRDRQSMVFQTPMTSKYANASSIPSTVLRNPREGEVILSSNGSPLGVFNTVVKPKNPGASIIPQTPGIFLPLDSGEVIDVEDVNVETLSDLNKQDALTKMQNMMSNMQKLMEKLEAPKL